MPQAEIKRLTVSVIVPTYNRADLLAKALTSALAQTQLPDEILVVDDGSSDSTPELLATYGPPVIAIRQENRGVSAARNLAIDRATGDIVMFLDSDDLLLPKCVERIAEEFESHPEVGVIYPDMEIIDGQGNRLGAYSQVARGRRDGDLLGELACQCILNMTSGAVRRTALQDVRFDETLSCAEDYKFWCQLAAHFPFFYINERLACYRYHGAQATTLRVRRMLEDAIRVQRGVMNMPEFARVSRRDRARALTTHGVKHALCDRTSEARLYFWKAIETDPLYITAFAVLAFSLLGGRFLRWTIAVRRRLKGNYIEDRAIRLTAQWSAAKVHDASAQLMPAQMATASNSIESVFRP
jgi:glycosyltransferase involved in cell wall biosynthesis